ncbi:hypothetical protein TthAA37_21570 (plasmid) [Thermus thermophilus]|nr:hypothetical protein TthAA220_20560 [Thermus thermophilus]BBL85798.1 hypothetical protein TthAA229_22790 [Thermus thermophilus]BCZ92968.1 hypothetical protein TthAA37_21570 [Thermus thermophilus]BCZ95604.1 hypothetical protein TthAK1_22210 [Thermus thermophilus]
MAEALARAEGALGLERLRGAEGEGSRAYFQGLARLLGPYGFGGRTRRPPRDPVNAALSYGYALLLGRVLVAVRLAGLHPEVGFLQAEGRRSPALALYLAGGSPSGAHLETLVLLDLLAFRDAQKNPPGLYYWRTASGQEVDFVLEAGETLLPVEVKATSRPTPKDAHGLLAFLAEYPEAPGGLLLHGGEEVFPLVDRVVAAPWWAVA